MHLFYRLALLGGVTIALASYLIQLKYHPTAQAQTADPPATLFSEVSAEAGVAFAHQGNAPVMPLGTGVAFGDYDNDGWLDLYVTNQAGANALYHNQGDGTFIDSAKAAGVTATGRIGAGASFADYDNDGWRDLYVVNIDGANLLYHNNGAPSGHPTFSDVTALAGVGDEGFGQSAAWGDYDNDGWLDLYVVNHIDRNMRSADRLYHNQQDGTFSDASDLLSEHLRSGAGFAASFVDYDEDDDLDLYVVNDYTFGAHRENVLWLNEGAGADGRWRFRNVSTRSQTNLAINSMGLAVGDFDNDRDLDFAVTNIGPNALLTNLGGGRFQNVSQAAGIKRGRLPGDREPLTWCALSLDYDHDSWLDLFLCGGPLDKGKGLPSVLYHNQQNGTFADVTPQAGLTGEYWTRAGAYGDYDNDGDVDFYVANYNQSAQLYRNNSQNTQWLTVRLTGTQSNRDGIGAKLRITAGGQMQVRQIQSGGSLGAGNDLAAYFGLGEAEQIDRLEIEWPSGIIQVLTDLPANQILAVTEAATSTVAYDLWLESLHLPTSNTIACGQPYVPQVQIGNIGSQPLVSATVALQVIASDGQSVLNETVSLPALAPFAKQSLRLPSWVPQAGLSYSVTVTGQSPTDQYLANNQWQTTLKASQFTDIAFAAGLAEEEPGSSVTTGDFNGDGLVDLYLVNSGRPNLLYLNQGDGTFVDGTAAAGVGHPGLGSSAVAADFDQDGALDIYLLNLNENNVYYHNRGDGTFEDKTKAAGLGNRGTSRVALTGDFDQDGDLDIYLVNDGQKNVLFLNQGNGKFTPAPDSAGVADRGGGRAAVAGDFDGDGDLDMYLVKDREANVLFINQGSGTFTVAPPAAGVADKDRGWGVVAADFDDDGDLDLYVTNLAQANTLYLNQGDATFVNGTVARGLGSALDSSTSATVADFDGDGSLDLVVANTGGQNNLLYLNDGAGYFREETAASGLATAANSVAITSADFNQDGSPNIFVVNARLPDQLFLNHHSDGAECWQ